MDHAVDMIALWRGNLLESLHRGQAVVCDGTGQIIAQWGAADSVIYPRSSSKILQALPLIESGAAGAAGLGSRQLALACASHIGAAMHTRIVGDWLSGLGLGESDLRCGVQPPALAPDRAALRAACGCVDQTHNNCSGKHAGFLTLGQHLGAGPEYIAPDHPVQRAAKDAFEYMVGETSPGFGIDGCSAPNFACTLGGLARAMARIAVADPDGPDKRLAAGATLRMAMAAHPELIAGPGKACTRLMGQLKQGGVVKTGAEGVYVAMLPQQGLGVALKIADGATRAAEAAIAALLVHLGALEPADEVAKSLIYCPEYSRAGYLAGGLRPVPGFPA